MPARSRALRVAGTGPMPMTAGSTPATAVETTRASGLQPQLARPLRLHEQHRRRAVVDPGAVAGRDRAAVPRNAGRSFASASADVSARGCSSRLTTTGLALPLRDRDRDDLVVEPAALDRGDGLLLARERERVLASRVDLPALGDVLGRLAHRVRVVQRRERGVQ